MADTKISALTELAETPNASDEIALVDKSDTTHAASGTTKRVTRSNLVGGLAATTGDTYTGAHDFGGADSLEIPNSATPTVDANGEVAVDTTVTDFSHGVMKYYGGEEMGVVAMPIAQFTSPTDGYVVGYNATNDEFELVANSGGGGISNVVEDTTPQLGGQLDVNGKAIGDGTLELLKFSETVSAVNEITVGNAATGANPTLTASGDDTNVGINLVAKGSGEIQAGGNRVLTTADEGTGNGLDADTLDGNEATAFATAAQGATADTALQNVVEDTTPQLGGQLDVNGQAIGDGTRELLTFTEDASAVNHVNIENEATGSGPIISAAGDDTNIDLNIAAKGTGNIKIGNFTFDADQSVGAGQDNYVLTYDNAGGVISLEAAAGGGGGGIPYGMDVKVAASGGDYTTLYGALNAGETRIFIEDGTYTETTIDKTGTSGITIIGESREGVILDYGTGGILKMGGTASGSEATDITLQNLTIRDGNSYNPFFQHVKRLTLLNIGCSFTNTTSSNGFLVNNNNSTNVKIDGLYILHTGTANKRGFGFVASDSHISNVFIESTYGSNTSEGIFINGGSGNTYSNVYQKGFGFAWISSSDSNYSGITVEDTHQGSQPGVVINASKNTINNITVLGNSTMDDGIAVLGAQTVINGFRVNDVTTASTYGIRIGTGADGSTIHGGTIQGCTNTVEIPLNADNNFVTNIICKANTTNTITDSGTGNTVTYKSVT